MCESLKDLKMKAEMKTVKAFFPLVDSRITGIRFIGFDLCILKEDAKRIKAMMQEGKSAYDIVLAVSESQDAAIDLMEANFKEYKAKITELVMKHLREAGDKDCDWEQYLTHIGYLTC